MKKILRSEFNKISRDYKTRNNGQWFVFGCFVGGTGTDLEPVEIITDRKREKVGTVYLGSKEAA